MCTTIVWKVWYFNNPMKASVSYTGVFVMNHLVPVVDAKIRNIVKGMMSSRSLWRSLMISPSIMSRF